MDANESFSILTDEPDGQVRRLTLSIDRVGTAEAVPSDQAVRVAQVVHCVRERLVLGTLWPPDGMTCPVETEVTDEDVEAARSLLAGDEFDL